MNEELLAQQVALLSKIEERYAAAPVSEKKFWKRADEIVCGSRDLGVARRMLVSATMHCPIPAQKDVLKEVTSWVSEQLLTEEHAVAALAQD